MSIQLNQAIRALENALYNYACLLIFNSPQKTKFTAEVLQSFVDDFVADEIIHGRIIAEANLKAKLEN